MSTSTSAGVSHPPNFTAALGEQLVAAHGRLRRRRRRRQTGLALSVVALLAMFAAASLSVFDSTPAAADAITVERRLDGSVLITINRTGALPAELQAELQRQHVNSTTTGCATGPSRVGTIMSVAYEGGAPPTDLLDRAGRHLVIPAGFTGVIQLTVGQAAASGERYVQPTDAFDDDEPLERVDNRNDATAAFAAATKQGLQVTVLGADSLPLDRVPTGGMLLTATMLSSSEIQLRVV